MTSQELIRYFDVNGVGLHQVGPDQWIAASDGGSTTLQIDTRTRADGTTAVLRASIDDDGSVTRFNLTCPHGRNRLLSNLLALHGLGEEYTGEAYHLEEMTP